MPTLEDGKHAIEQGNLQQARLIFEAILQETPRSEEAWLGLAQVLTDSKDRRICYENVLKINKTNKAAREGLRNLEPQANPLVEALQRKAAAPPADDDDDAAADATMVTSRRAAMGPATTSSDAVMGEAEGGPPSYALVAIGLLLSVVVFAIGSGVVFMVLTSITGG